MHDIKMRSIGGVFLYFRKHIILCISTLQLYNCCLCHEHHFPAHFNCPSSPHAISHTCLRQRIIISQLKLICPSSNLSHSKPKQVDHSQVSVSSTMFSAPVPNRQQRPYYFYFSSILCYFSNNLLRCSKGFYTNIMT
jgi:hypothetical protein